MASVSQVHKRNDQIRSQTKLAEGQATHTTSVKNKKNDLAAFTKIIEDTKKMVLDSMIIASKSQMIDNGGGGGSMASDLVQSTSTLANLQVQEVEMNLTLKQMEQQTQANLAQMSQMVGKRVSIEDGSRSFSGKTGEQVKFQYNILGKDIPANAIIQTQISLLDKDGKKILSKTENGKHIGKNSFIWDGKDDIGNRVDVGSYNISVTASYTLPGSHNASLPLSVTTTRDGDVTGVTRDEDDNINVVVDGQQIDRKYIRGLMMDGKDNVMEEAKGPISDYTGYIGQKVQVKQEKVNFNNNKTNVPFISKNAATGATVTVRFFDTAGNFVAYSENVQDIKAGQNNFSWSGEDAKSAAALKDMRANKMLSYVPVDSYRYEVSITTKNKDGVETTYKLDNKEELVIDSLDKTNGKIMLVSGDSKFNIEDVTKLTQNTPEKAQASHIALLQEGASLIDKVVSFKDDTITYDGAGDRAVHFTIPNPGVDFNLNSATIHILDKKDNILASITPAKIYFDDAEPIPGPVSNMDEVAVLFTPSSKDKITNYYNQEFPARAVVPAVGGAVVPFTSEEKEKINHYISQSFRAGQIFQVTYDALDADAKREMCLKNTGYVKGVWNGKGPDGAQLPAGDYKFLVSYNIEHNTTHALQLKELSMTPLSLVRGTHVKDNQVVLELNNGIHLPIDKVLTVRG